MRGYTGVCVGAIHNVIVVLKSKLIASGKKKLKLKSSTWQTCVQACKMPAILTGIDAKLPYRVCTHGVHGYRGIGEHDATRGS